jgi:hypothetical protein
MIQWMAYSVEGSSMAKKKDKKVPDAKSRKKERKTAPILKDIRSAVKTRKAAQEKITTLVVKARSEGYTWVDIADVLGITPQGARQGYVRHQPDSDEREEILN